MIELVFQDSEKGTMTCAKNYNQISDSASIGFGLMLMEGESISEAEQKRLTDNMRHKWETRAPFPGDASDVLSLTLMLDIGDISDEVPNDTRRDVLRRMFCERYGDESERDSAESHALLWQNTCADLQKLRKRAGEGEPVRVWYSDAPYSRCGLCHAMQVLSDCDCRVSAIRLPEFILEDDNAFARCSWAEVSPVALGSFLPLEHELSQIERRSMATDWRALQAENKPLRAVVNGCLHGVNADFYDTFLCRSFEGERMQVAALIGRTLGRYRLGISDWLLAERIRAMLKSGELLLAEQADAFYLCTLAKA